jgi:hypothetical protein
MMIALVCFVRSILISPFKSDSRLEAENVALRHQVMVLRRQVRGRVHLTNLDRLFLVQLYRWFPSILRALFVVRPETVIRWHRAGFRCYWRWKSRGRGGRPPVSGELRALIRRMSVENVLWSAPRIKGELLKLGFTVAQSTVAKLSLPKTQIRAYRWCSPPRHHIDRNCRLGDLDAELEQLAMDLGGPCPFRKLRFARIDGVAR